MHLDEPGMPPTGPRHVAAWLDATPAELAGLVVLLAGAVVAALLLWWQATPRDLGPAGPPAAAPSPVPVDVTVHVTGAVARPGVVRLPGGARVEDALRAVGGASADAATEALNLARVLVDGEQIVVPSVDDPVASPDAVSAEPADGRVDLNAATSGDLEELPGIGPVLAERIVAWREDHGPFREVGQLREVPGIGERTFQNLAELVVVR